MKRSVIGAVGAIALVLSVATPAKADWQFTKWGMSKEEFKQASPVALNTDDDFCKKLLDSVSEIGTSPEFLSSDWDAGRFKFTNCYVFGENNSLNSVYLNLKNQYSGNLLIEALNNKYGMYSSSSTIELFNIEIYEWRTEKNLITSYKRITPDGIINRVSFHDIQPILASESKL